jgi:hypothetical protein
MKTLPVWAAATLMLLPNVAAAKTKTTIIAFDGYCDVVTINVTGGLVAGKDSCASGFGGGLITKDAGESGKAIVAGVQFPPEPGYQFVLKLSYPLVTGGTWSLYVTTDGMTLNPYEAGTYTIQTTPSQTGRGSASVLAALRR